MLEPMKMLRKYISALALAILCFSLPDPAMAVLANPGEIITGKKIYNSGLGVRVPACQNCHGAHGLGSDDLGTPRLASQVYTYLFKELTDFATDKRTDDVMHQMNNIAKAMTEEQRKDVAAYLHTLQEPYIGSNLVKLKKKGVSTGDAARGSRIVNFGLPSENVAACQSCHGYKGHSAGLIFPAISGQNYVYLTHELKLFRRGAQGHKNHIRTNDYMGAMRAVAAKLSDRDIKDAATYLTGVKPPPPPSNPLDPSEK